MMGRTQNHTTVETLTNRNEVYHLYQKTATQINSNFNLIFCLGFANVPILSIKVSELLNTLSSHISIP